MAFYAIVNQRCNSASAGRAKDGGEREGRTRLFPPHAGHGQSTTSDYQSARPPPALVALPVPQIALVSVEMAAGNQRSCRCKPKNRQSPHTHPPGLASSIPCVISQNSYNRDALTLSAPPLSSGISYTEPPPPLLQVPSPRNPYSAPVHP